jgi:hypothetical protein
MDESLKSTLGNLGALLKYSLALLSEIEKARGQAQEELLNTPAHLQNTAEELKSSLLAPHRDALARCKLNEQEARELKSLKRYSAVWRANKSVKETEKRLRKRIKTLERDEQSELISDISKLLIIKSVSQEAKRKELTQSIARHDEIKRQIKILVTKLEDVGRAIQSGRQVGTSTADIVQKLHLRLSASDLSGALLLAADLRYQPTPPESQYAKWQDEANDILQKATSRSVGLRSTAHHSTIAEGSALLIAKGLRDRAFAKSIEQAPINSWMPLVQHITSLKNYIHEAQWSIYWALFQVGQDFTIDLSRSLANEENLSGVLTKGLTMQLQHWAGSRVHLLKYAQPKAVMSTMRLGGMAAEASLGADVGILIDINLGNLQVRKLVLLQAKVSRNFKANIGSEPTGPESKTQLQKLVNFERDFYLFYNWGELETNNTFLPTVASIPALFEENSLKDSDKAALSVRVDTRSCGWDFASFFTFGLCTPGTGIGQELGTKDTFEGILAGLNYPPHRLVIASFNGLEMTLDMEKRIRLEYEGTEPSKKSYGLDHEVGPGQDLNNDNYDLEL